MTTPSKKSVQVYKFLSICQSKDDLSIMLILMLLEGFWPALVVKLLLVVTTSID